MNLTLAHAITCHKLQGSHAARVVVAIYASRVVDPSWVYTAITRAERQVILVGDLKVLQLALKKPWTSENRRVGFAWPLCQVRQSPFRPPQGNGASEANIGSLSPPIVTRRLFG
jgi:UvrD-like helicase C-terminal domain